MVLVVFNYFIKDFIKFVGNSWGVNVKKDLYTTKYALMGKNLIKPESIDFTVLSETL